MLKLVGLLLTIVYSVLQAKYFGVSQDVESYFAATTILYSIISLTQSGQLAEIYLPIYHNLEKKHGLKIAVQSFSIVLNWVLTVFMFLGLIVFVLAPVIIEFIIPGFEQEYKQQTVLIFRVCLFLIQLDIFNSFTRVFLNARGIYGSPESIGLLNSSLSILAILFLYDLLGVWVLVLGLVLGKIASSLGYFLLLRKNGFKYFLKYKSSYFDHRGFFKSVFHTSGYVIATQFYTLILTSSLTLLPQGYFGVFKYVQNIYAKTRGIVLQPLLTVFFTNFSKSIQHRSADTLYQIRQSISYLLVVNTIIIVMSYCFGDSLLLLLWGSDKFGPEFISVAYELFVLNCVALLISSIGNVYRKVGISLGLAKSLYLFWAGAQILTGVLVYWILAYFDVKGLNYIIPLNVIFLSLVSVLIVYYNNKSFYGVFELDRIFKLLVLVIPISYLGRYLNSFLFTDALNQIFEIALLIVFCSTVTFVFIIAGDLLKIPELSWIVTKVKRRLLL